MRQIPVDPGNVWSEVEGDIENVDGVIRIVRIRVKYHLKVPADKRSAADRALATHESKCPAAMSVKGAIAIEYSAEIDETAAS